MSTEIHPGERVSFLAREFGPADPPTGRVVTLTGTVTRALWGRAGNVTVRTDDGRTFVRLLPGITRVTDPAEPRTCGNCGTRTAEHVTVYPRGTALRVCVSCARVALGMSDEEIAANLAEHGD